jgi:hypothetical protein
MPSKSGVMAAGLHHRLHSLPPMEGGTQMQLPAGIILHPRISVQSKLGSTARHWPYRRATGQEKMPRMECSFWNMNNPPPAGKFSMTACSSFVVMMRI